MSTVHVRGELPLDAALFLLLFVIYTNLSSVMVGNYGWPSIVSAILVLTGGLILARRILHKNEYFGWATPAFLLALYAIVGASSLLQAKDVMVSISNLISYTKNAAIAFVIILLVQRPQALRTACWALLSGGTFMGSVSVFQQLTAAFNTSYGGVAWVVQSASGYRSGGPISDPNYYAQILVVLLPVAVDRAWNEDHWILRVLAAWTLFICTFALVFTFSRGGFLAFLVAFLIMAILRPTRAPSLWLGLITVLAISRFLPSTYQERITSIVSIFPGSPNGGYADESFQGRVSENLAAWNMFREHPIFGVGIGNYNTHYQEYSRKLGLDPRPEARSAHNLYLEIAAEQGLLGLVVFGSVIALSLRQIVLAEASLRALHKKKMANLVIAIGVSFVAYLFSSIFLHDAYPRYLWVLFGLAWAAGQSAGYVSRLPPAQAALL